MKKTLFLILSVVAMLSMIACTQPANQPISATLAQSNKPRETRSGLRGRGFDSSGQRQQRLRFQPLPDVEGCRRQYILFSLQHLGSSGYDLWRS